MKLLGKGKKKETGGSTLIEESQQSTSQQQQEPSKAEVAAHIADQLGETEEGDE